MQLLIQFQWITYYFSQTNIMGIQQHYKVELYKLLMLLELYLKMKYFKRMGILYVILIIT